MKALILAAGRGERMMPLTANLPKPMLTVNNKPLIQYHIEHLARVGIIDIVINHAWCGDAIINYLGDGRQFGVNIRYSDESTGALETAGGIINALPLLVDMQQDLTENMDQFIVINGDVFCDVNLANLPILSKQQTACLWLTDNPEHNPLGDFILDNGIVGNKTIQSHAIDTLTFSGIALYKACFFANEAEKRHGGVKDVHEKVALGPLLKKAAQQCIVQGVKLDEHWTDVGTPERLAEINKLCTSKDT